MKRHAAFLILCLLAACGDRESGADSDISASPPTLEQVRVPGLDSVGSPTTNLSFAVSASGHVAWIAGNGPEQGILNIVDVGGRVLTRRDTKIKGPGMLQGRPFMSFVEDDVLLALDLGGSRFVGFDPRGEVLFSSPTAVLGIPAWMSRDSVDVYPIDTSSPQLAVPGLFRLSLRNGASKVLVSNQHPAVSALVGERGLSILNPAFASRADEIVLADTYGFSFQSFSPDGTPLSSWKRNVPPKVLSPEEIEARLSSTKAEMLDSERARLSLPMQHFNQLRFDGAGRLWTISPDANRGLISHVFDGTRYLGEVKMPCPVALFDLSFRGDFMLLACLSPNLTQVSLRVYRLRG